jgi:hypothetical protein
VPEKPEDLHASSWLLPGQPPVRPPIPAACARRRARTARAPEPDDRTPRPRTVVSSLAWALPPDRDPRQSFRRVAAWSPAIAANGGTPRPGRRAGLLRTLQDVFCSELLAEDSSEMLNGGL